MTHILMNVPTKERLLTSAIPQMFGVAKYKWIIFAESTVFVTSKDGNQYKLHLSTISNISLQEKLIWNELSISTTTGQKINVGGLPRFESTQFHKHLVTSFAKYYYGFHTSIVVELLKGYPKKDQYFKKQYLEELETNARQFTSNFKYLDVRPSSQGQIAMFDLAKRLSSNGDVVRRKHNAEFMANEKVVYKNYFDSVEANPLTEMQVDASIINESANLVVAGAGSGKTSVMVARAGYLIRKGLASENEILMVAFNNAAAKELRERLAKTLDIHNIQAKTFHSLGLEIIARATKEKPSLAPWEESKLAMEKVIWELVEQEIQDVNKYRKLLRIFASHICAYKSEFEFEDEIEYKKYIYDSNLLTLKGERVKSFEEVEIANFLYLNQIEYEYERPYEVSTVSEDYRQYEPDFYLTEYEIYLEHFGIDRNGKTAPFVDQKSYSDGIEWKRELHEQYETHLIETYSWMRQEGHLLDSLEHILIENGVEVDPIPYETAIEQLNASGTVSAFAGTMATFINHVRSNRHRFDVLRERSKTDERLSSFIDIAEPVMSRYELLKRDKNVIDFNDMVELAIEYINSGRYKSQYKFILADEFQDISVARAELIRALFKQTDECVLTAVGDDWQSINRFAGSDISIFRDFSEFFGYSEVVKLDYSFRYNDKISSSSQNFIEKNPSQLKKRIKTIKSAQEKPITHYWEVKNIHETVDSILEQISIDDPEASVLILARYRFKQLENFKTLQRKYSSLSIAQMTVHGSKGLEADHVILLGLEAGKFGFPSNIENDPVIDLVLVDGEDYAYAEERRLFYVVLTRAKNSVFLLGDMSNSSVFSKELMDGYEDEVLHIYPSDIVPETCPDCEDGMLLIRQGRNGLFFGCTNFKIGCSYTKPVTSCSECFTGIIQKKDGTDDYACNSCGHIAKTCRSCGGLMNLKKGRNGDFYGCSNYSRTGCRYTENIFSTEDLPRLKISA